MLEVKKYIALTCVMCIVLSLFTGCSFSIFEEPAPRQTETQPIEQITELQQQEIINNITEYMKLQLVYQKEGN